MFDHNSRYFDIETVELKTADGRTVKYKRRRFLPSGEDKQTLAEVVVTEGDRLDLITSRAIGDPEQFWKVADANNAMNPFRLTTELGRILKIPMP